MRSKKALLLLVLLFLSSCAVPINKQTDTVQQHIERGEHKKGLALFLNSCSLDQDGMLQNNCRADAELIRRIADQRYDRTDFADAGALYHVLIRSGIVQNAPPKSLSFDVHYIGAKIRECSRALTEEGLVLYREQKLDEAVSIWEKILSFDPENQSVKKAVDTARRQQLRLRKYQ